MEVTEVMNLPPLPSPGPLPFLTEPIISLFL